MVMKNVWTSRQQKILKLFCFRNRGKKCWISNGFQAFMPRSSAFIGRLACCHCISFILTLLILIKPERRVASMSRRISSLALGEERNMRMSFVEAQEAFSKINESWAGIRRMRSTARFNSDNLLSWEASTAELIESGAPNKEEFFISSCIKSVRGETDTGADFHICRY